MGRVGGLGRIRNKGGGHVGEGQGGGKKEGGGQAVPERALSGTQLRYNAGAQRGDGGDERGGASRRSPPLRGALGLPLAPGPRADASPEDRGHRCSGHPDAGGGVRPGAGACMIGSTAAPLTPLVVRLGAGLATHPAAGVWVRCRRFLLSFN